MRTLREAKDKEMNTRVALTGDVALELIAPYFRNEGYEVYVPAGFAAWRTELLDKNSNLHKFKPDFIFDVTSRDECLSRECPDFFDERMKALASQPYSLRGIRTIVDEFGFLSLAAPKKILAVDADNTLWRGIISEDGINNVEPYVEFQKGIKSLAEDGVVLVLLSKNDPFEFRDDMPLSNRDFACRRVNWRPKAGNLIEACRELNLSTDSVVFLDDNPHERMQMKAHLPEVAVPPFSHPDGSTIRRLREYFFGNGAVTEEDRLRAADYRARQNIKISEYANADEYLDALQLEVCWRKAQEQDLERLAQMAGKTNQFNATTIRRTRQDFAAMLESPNEFSVYVFRTRDRFGKQGIVCYIVVDIAAKRITDFVMSCRAMGRTLEYFAYDSVCRAFGEMLPVDFVPTAKNKPFKEFLDSGMKGKSHYHESMDNQSF